MKSKTLTFAIAITLLATIAFPARLAAQEQERSPSNEPHVQRYTVTFLGTLGGTFSQPFGINNKGEVDGIATLPGDKDQHAFFWRDGLMTDLGTLGGPNSNGDFGGRLGPNGRGEVVGGAETSTPDPLGDDFCFLGHPLICLPFIWKKGVMTPLPTLGGYSGFASDINNRGRVVGLAANTKPEPNCFNQLQQAKPVIWEADEIEELPTFPGDTGGQGISINDRGQVVGISGGCQSGPTFALHALLWQNGTVTNLGSLGGTMNVAARINNRGQVCGLSSLPGDTIKHAFLWTKNSGIRDLGTLSPGDSYSNCTGINSRGQVVGESCGPNGCRAFLWQNGLMTDLNPLVPGGGSTLSLFEAEGINSRGQFAVLGFDANSGDCCAFLATPSDDEAARGSTMPTVPGQTSQRPNVVLPENVRRMLQQRLGHRFNIPSLGTPKN